MKADTPLAEPDAAERVAWFSKARFSWNLATADGLERRPFKEDLR